MEFEFDGRRIPLAARRPASDEFRNLVDGVPIPAGMQYVPADTSGTLNCSTQALAGPVGCVHLPAPSMIFMAVR
ncbi:hypothetical protein [Actinomadura monticuli]|uniref:Uncharacterized protein n=1 Tax=Actinomadura monticuli TaxID=3097367 RepID=A0ABV4QHB3_9ACTN